MEANPGVLIPRLFFLNRRKMISYLDELETTADAARSLYLPLGLSLPEIRDLLERAIDPPDMPWELPDFAAGSKTGAVLFWSCSRKCLILPPFPIADECCTNGYNVEPLRSLLRTDLRIGLILVRLGAYAVGLCRGENLITSKVGTGLVHGRHKKGGSSQQRFRRHREKQIEFFLDRVCCHAQEHLEPQAKALDYVVYGGAWTTILSLQKQCPFLGQFDNRVLPPLLDIPKPNRRVLEIAVGRVWSSSVIEWHVEEVVT
ncbi:MAG: hypothetical protein FJ012_00515 [Chloroflexi bacterium]|nr:hypothetical protein [Chloroflexota bacterium]